MLVDPHNQIVIPAWAKWMAEHSEDAVTEPSAQRVQRIVTTPPRDRSGSFSASSAGLCPRRQVFGYHGLKQKPHDIQLRNVFKDGHWRHLRWQTMLLDAGIIHQVEGSLKWEEKLSKGSIDGAGIVPMDHPREEWRGKDFGFELKGVSGFQFSKYKGKQPKQDHLNQVDRYFVFTGFDLFVILYEDKSTQDLIEWVIERNDKGIKEQEDELDYLVKNAKEDTLPPIKPACEAMMGSEFKDCPYGSRSGPCLSIENMDDLKGML